MAEELLRVKVGDRCILTIPGLPGRALSPLERLGTVTEVRPTSFDAGGLCFRLDGREWRGRGRIRMITEEEEQAYLRSQAAANQERGTEDEHEAREEFRLASLLSYRHEEEWVRLGLEELRRIAGLLGISLGGGEAAGTAEAEGGE